MRLIVYLFLLILAANTGCDSRGGDIKLSQDDKKTKGEILRRIPIGSPMDQARKIMEENGFVCTMHINDSFVENTGSNKQILHHGKDFLFCDKKRRGIIACDQRWQVFLVRSEDTVAEVYVNYGTICL
jgi:hypothetical protein